MKNSSYFLLTILLKITGKELTLVDGNIISQQGRSTTIFMLNNLISNPHQYVAPKARETNTKASVNANSNSIRDMLIAF